MGNLFDGINEMFEASKPQKEPENYGEFRDRILKDIGDAFPALRPTPEPNPEDKGDDKGKPKPDDKPKETHPFFKSIFGSKE